jgi:hypothetical protein
VKNSVAARCSGEGPVARSITQRRRQEEVAATELAPAEVVVFFRDVLATLVRRYGWLAMWIVRTID